MNTLTIAFTMVILVGSVLFATGALSPIADQYEKVRATIKSAR